MTQFIKNCKNNHIKFKLIDGQQIKQHKMWRNSIHLGKGLRDLDHTDKNIYKAIINNCGAICRLTDYQFIILMLDVIYGKNGMRRNYPFNEFYEIDKKLFTSNEIYFAKMDYVSQLGLLKLVSSDATAIMGELGIPDRRRYLMSIDGRLYYGLTKKGIALKTLKQ